MSTPWPRALARTIPRRPLWLPVGWPVRTPTGWAVVRPGRRVDWPGPLVRAWAVARRGHVPQDGPPSLPAESWAALRAAGWARPADWVAALAADGWLTPYDPARPHWPALAAWDVRLTARWHAADAGTTVPLAAALWAFWLADPDHLRQAVHAGWFTPRDGLVACWGAWPVFLAAGFGWLVPACVPPAAPATK